ncbi:Ig-like domain-containing protein [Escherichia coli]
MADGNNAITYTLNVRDAAGQPVKDKAVQWSTDLGTLSAQQGATSARAKPL